MKVSELIDLLSKMPQDAEVGIWHDGYYVEKSWETEEFRPLLTNDGKVQIAYLYCHP